jgi:FtsZ-interacting cell division protein ZipA
LLTAREAQAHFAGRIWAGYVLILTRSSVYRMSTAAIIAIVVGAILLVVLIVVGTRMARQRHLEGRREKAGELRQQAQHRDRTAQDARAATDEESARAERVRAEADEKEAEARRHEIAAQQRAGEAEGKTVVAREHHERAREVDPDVSDSGEDEARDLDEEADSASRPR